MTVVSGARAKLFISTPTGRQNIGYATSISVSENQQNVRVDTIGDFFTKEIEPVGAAYSVQIGFIRILEKPLEDIGIIPRGGTIDRVTFPELSIDAFDQVGDKVLFSIEGMRLESRQLSLDARGLLSNNVTLQARKLIQ